ncbi:Nif3-like dinuclear metal center hexameric protein [Saxibacter everestensis]|uniref:GTP cyclohydrolase 1 type 2 homolog n=1 Tax=Saxibacter everestensis TaxID=2909229 RepID=A0ABY8QWV0_9MICO|nr:Nif3-like dinuclear metal center hexameric protein [Brevibacteriaceae bacterium ZFBP1038]
MLAKNTDQGPTLAQVLAVAERLWPYDTAESWDVVGLAVGDPSREIRTILFAVDPVDATIAEAEAVGADLLFTHHPLLLRGVTSVAANTTKGGAIDRLIRGNIALFNAHTNADGAIGGVSEVLIEALGITRSRPLDDPDSIEPVFGIGRVGNLPTSVSLREFAETVAAAMPATKGGVRVSGDLDADVRRVAVCGGAGDGYFDQVRAAGADVYVTADLRHHPASEAREQAARPALESAGRGAAGTPHLIDVSHWASESLWLHAAAAEIRSALAQQGTTVETIVSSVVTDPWTLRLPT